MFRMAQEKLKRRLVFICRARRSHSYCDETCAAFSALIFVRYQRLLAFPAEGNPACAREWFDIQAGFERKTGLYGLSLLGAIVKISHSATGKENRLHQKTPITPHPLTFPEILALSRKQITSPLR